MSKVTNQYYFILIKDNEEYAEDKSDKKVTRGARIAVSAEAYGKYNKKEDFKPIVHQKTEEQKAKIKSKIVQSFLFDSLETNDLIIVIDAMEEVKYR